MEMYRFGHKEATKAEFMQEWLLEKFGWDECIAYLTWLTPISGAPKRALEESYRVNTQKRLREHFGETYRRQG